MAKGIELSLEKMVGETYKRVAEWHNNDGTAPGLKVIAHEIVETVLDLAFEQLDVKTKTGIKEEAAKQVLDAAEQSKNAPEKPEAPIKEEKIKDANSKILNKLF